MSEYGEGGRRAGGSVAPSYAELLALRELLSLQRLRAEPPVHDELLFVVVHQAHELWFKQMLAELTESMRQLEAGEWANARATLERLCMIVGLLTRHVDVLDTMTQENFQRFRAVLGTASGLHSEQYRRIEALSGRGSEGSPREASVAVAEPANLRDAFARALEHALPSGAPSGKRNAEAGLPAALQRLYADPGAEAMRAVADGLLEYDGQMAAWRARHMEMARKMIGSTSGTGGSTGVPYLRAAMDRRFFPELAAARSAAHAEPRLAPLASAQVGR